MDNSKGDYVDLVLCSSPKFLQGGGCPKARKICGRHMHGPLQVSSKQYPSPNEFPLSGDSSARQGQRWGVVKTFSGPLGVLQLP